MALYRDEAVVLRTAKLGEADRIITLLTRDHGKVRAVAKGVRRTKSRFGEMCIRDRYGRNVDGAGTGIEQHIHQHSPRWKAFQGV